MPNFLATYLAFRTISKYTYIFLFTIVVAFIAVLIGQGGIFPVKNSTVSSPRRDHTSRKTKRSSSRATRNGIRQIDGGYRASRRAEGRASLERAQRGNGCSTNWRAMIDVPKLRACPPSEIKLTNRANEWPVRSLLALAVLVRVATTRCPIFSRCPLFFEGVAGLCRLQFEKE